VCILSEIYLRSIARDILGGAIATTLMLPMASRFFIATWLGVKARNFKRALA